MGTTIEEGFRAVMLNTYDTAAKLGYRANYFRRMVLELGAVEAAKQLIADEQFSEGFTQLFMLERLDLSVEALVLRSEWRSLFTEVEQAAARRKLEEAKYSIPA